MSNIHYTKLLKSISDVYDSGKKAKVICLENTTKTWNGQQLQIDDKEMVNFGTCGYLGLETDRRLIERSMEYTNKFGTQFSVSRSFLISDIVTNLEHQLSKVFDNSEVFVFSSTSLAHGSVLPIIIHHKDAIVLDKQVHFSVNSGTQLIPSKDVPRLMVKHNNMNMLEGCIKRLKDKHEKIWYLVDGVYSMFGDFPPIRELNELMSKYEQLHLYVDDAHGMAWAGKNGSGTIFDKIIHRDRLVLSTTMAKGFGSIGGIVVFPDKKLYSKVQKFGGPLSYSHPLPPAVVGAGMAVTDILLSPEIYKIQEELADRINYCNHLLEQTDLPIMSHPRSPIKFVGVGELDTGFKVHRKILDNGFYINVALFPAVPINNTGLRFTITRHVNKEHIKQFVQTVQHHYHETLQEESIELRSVRKAFKLPLEKAVVS